MTPDHRRTIVASLERTIGDCEKSVRKFRRAPQEARSHPYDTAFVPAQIQKWERRARAAREALAAFEAYSSAFEEGASGEAGHAPRP